MKAEEWALLDRQVLGVIRLTLSKSVAHNVVKEKTTTDLMKALSGMYEKPSANNKVHLMKKLFNLKMAENASVAQHLNEFNTITNQLSSVEIDFDDEIRALIVLASLPNSWETMKMAVSNSTGKEKLKYNDIRYLILAEEIRLRDASETSGSGSALNLETRSRDQANKYNAGTVGKQVTLKVDSPLDDWILDSGASFHTTPHREIIQNYVAGDFGKVYLADGSALDVVGLGDVRISLPNGSVWLLEKVRHILDLRRNLISVGQLDDEGHAILFVGGTWKVTKGARVLASGKKIGTLYMTSSPRDTIAVADAKLKSIDFDRTPKAEKLELVHTDLWGPSPVASLGGSRYYITFIDDSSRKGIMMEKTIPRTPQQNGVVERMNRTLNERARSMRFWDEQNRKIIRSRNVIFNEQVLYKDRSTVVSDVTEMDKKKSEFVNLDELTESTVQKGGEEDKENVNLQVDLSTHVAEVSRSSRNIRPPQRYSLVLNYLLLTNGGKPECYYEALQDENSNKWELAMKDEMDFLLGNETWKLTELPIGKKALHNKWKEDIDYTKIFSLVVKMLTIRLVLGMVATENLHLEQLDVKTTFLHGDLEEDLYMIQPEGFIVQGQENLVCKLRKSLYGLKQGSDIEEINNLKKQLSKQFAMKDLGAAKQILGMRIIRDKANGTLKFSQSKYVKKFLNRFNMNEAKPVSTPLGSHFKLSKE
ncbi:Retrovirus-related Pol polyprotein from transposon TNT 1-94 [Vitis vinifera]|uniref:Retrovirus-related Pol polyprotein from transposon TNT 1-94 n=1 Tax=Vitis vinifera TaxID=29760 RepID=A0A438JEH9_VITVI|nr:Retrovirus-related Pol polyprotein from transposon TNT 1-94 [Vitis vinifera]